MSDLKSQIIVRFPPSPTGLFHIGSARTALYNYLFARKNGGKFILRIEDTDKERSKPEFETNIYDSLNWLGIDYDNKDNVFRQSERTKIYEEKIKELINKGFAYVSLEQEGENKEVIRFKNPGGKVKFNDLIRGEIEMDVSDLKDFIIAKNMHEPLYHLAVVTDDLESGVTHVIRGEDGISNTPRQILLIEALGGERPVYAHLPLVLASDRSKLSKRKHGESVSLNYYREQGYLPEAIRNFLALIGWNPGTDQELFSLDELVKAFDFSKVQKSGAIFNVKKLDWMNKEYLKLMPEVELNENILKRLEKNNFLEKINSDMISKLYPIISDRIAKWSDIDEMIGAGELDYFIHAPSYEKEMLFWKKTRDTNLRMHANDTNIQTETKKHLERILEIFENSDEKNFKNAYEVKNLIWDYAESEGRGAVLWPLRVTLSGREKSPDPFTLASIIGKEETISRIKKAIEELR